MSYAPPRLPFRSPHTLDGDLPTVVTANVILYPYSAKQVMSIRRGRNFESGTLLTNAEAKQLVRRLTVPTPAEQAELLKEWNNAR